ncbi:NAD-dependent deacylase [Actinoplanes sp. M2I2]|uniref:SIR2 family NAD-dependent protein deacylase n=1 Tax=Actinoplanes sp. M2I2 TaxID=1734444 RepID=UPI002020B9D5|nr:NAD-dependent deacylase [Actinoplanes sp. M2I2]
MDPVREAAELIGRARRLVVFTGAGMSAESGIPTFRDALTGLWARFDAEALATPEAFERDPALVWGWYEGRRAAVERVRPNAGHEAIARRDCTVITQNVDDLHERAGSADVVHLHGSLFTPRCSVCATPAVPPAAPGGSAGATSAGATSAGAMSAGAMSAGAAPAVLPGGDEGPIEPPACAVCGAAVRPGVVWFGEQLPAEAFERAVDAAAHCDVLLTVGTSALVYPAADLPWVAARSGGAVIQVNPQPTPLDPICAVSLRAPAAAVLPEIIS